MRPGIGEGLSVETLAGESREAFRTSDLEKRRLRYGSARENAYQFVPYLRRAGEEKLADEVSKCGNYLTFREYFTIGQTRLSKICTCKRHLLCPLCAIRRGAKSVRVYKSKVEELRKRNPKLRSYLVTLTVKDGPDLGERFNHLTAGVRAYHKRRKGKGQEGEVSKASAAVWSYEFKRGKTSGMWHPHVHAIWLSEKAPDPFKLSREWRDITGDSFIVDVTPMDEADPIGAFCEVFKYAVKFSELPDADRLHGFRTLKGKRLQGSFGELRGLDVEPSDSDDLLEDLPYIERLYQFVPGAGYKLTSESSYDPKTDDDRILEALVGMGWPDDQIMAFMRERGERHAA
jgi:hypothetical protein